MAFGHRGMKTVKKTVNKITITGRETAYILCVISMEINTLNRNTKWGQKVGIYPFHDTLGTVMKEMDFWGKESVKKANYS